MKVFLNPLRGVWLLAFSLLLMNSLPAQYLVGPCSGATHATLQDAFNDVMSGSPISGTFVIEVCGGTYVDQPATLGVVPYASGGGQLVIRKGGASAAPVVFQASNPGLWSLLEFQGSQNVEVEDITFDILPSPSRVGYMTVYLQSGAGEISFRNCRFKAYSLLGSGASFSSRLGFSSLITHDRDGDLYVEDCHFEEGGTGIYLWNTAPLAADNDVWVNRCTFDEHMFDGLVMVSAVDTVQIRNCEFNSQVLSPKYYGIEAVYEANNYFEVRDNQMDIRNKDWAWGISDDSFLPVIEDNLIYGEEVYKEFIGIHLPGFITRGTLSDNEINYFRGWGPEATDSSAIGIKVRAIYAAAGGAPGTEWIDIERNSISLDNFYDSRGIWIEGKNGSVQQHLYCRENTILLLGEQYVNNVVGEGISLTGNQVGMHNLRIEDNVIQGNFGLPPRFLGIQVADLELLSPAVVLNNHVETNSNRDFSNGIFLLDLDAATTQENYLGNNTVSLPFTPTVNRGIALQNVEQWQVHHNSVNIWGSPSGTTGSVALEVLNFTPATSYNNEIWNNILSNPAGGKAINIGQSYCVSRNDYNLLYNNSSSNLGGYAGSTAANLVAWQSLSGDAANSLAGDPLFVSNSDLHIPLGSPAYQTAAVKSYPTHASDLTRDIDNQLRGFLGNREIGADELGRAGNNGPFKAMFTATSDLKVWPNPSAGQVSLQLPASANAWTLRLQDLQGKILLEKQVFGTEGQLDLSHLPSGTYLLHLVNQDHSLQQKLMLK